MPLPTYLMSNFPSVRPSLNLQFDSQPTPEDMTSHLASVGATFSRASIGTYTDANGLIQEASAGQARPNYSSAGVHEGLLIEESRTNLVTSSEGDFIGWNTAGGASFTPLSAIAPDGTVSAGTLVVPSSSARLENSSISVPDGEHTFSIYLKSSSGSFPIDIKIMGGTTVTVTDEWQRFTVTETVSSFNKLQIRAIASTGNQTLYVWGAQVEAGSFPTSYIPTIPTFTDRDSVATFLGSDGLIQTASVNVARSDTYKYIDDELVEVGLLLEGSAENFITSSEDFSVSDWVKLSGASVTTNQAVAPDGKASADLLTSTAGGSNFDRIDQTVSITSGNDVTFSLFVKQYESDDKVTIRLEGTNLGTAGTDTNVNYKFAFSTEELTKQTGGTAKSTFVEDYGNGWYRIGITVDNATIDGALIYPAFSSADGVSVYIWGAQLEEGSQATSYFKTVPDFTSRASTATFFNSSGVLSTASSGVARTDHKYIDGQWVEAGLLLEAQSTNLLVRSQHLGDTWVTINTTVTTNQVNGLDGTLTADLLTEDSNSGQHYLSQSGTFSSGTTYTFSTFAKNASGTRYLQLRPFGIGSGVAFASFDLVNGEIPSGGTGGTDFDSALIEDVGNGWYRCSMTATYTSTPTGFMFTVSNSATSELPSYTGNNTSGFYIWGAQVEAGSQPTSYIPTTTASATRSADVYSAQSSADRTRDADSYTTATKTRSADVCYIDGTAFTDFYNQEQGTFFVFWEGFTDGGVDRWIGVHDSSKANVFDDRIIFAFSTSAESIRLTIVDDGVTQTSSVIDTNVPQTTPNKYALAVKLNDVDSYQDGVQVFSDSSVTMPSADKLIFHNGAGVRPFQGYIRKLIYFPRRLDNNELIKLTQ